MSDRDALEAAVAAHPAQDAPRLALADWLDDHGTAADRLRAAFIRGQIAAVPVVGGGCNARQLVIGAQVNDLLTRGVWHDPRPRDELGFLTPVHELSALELRNRSRSHRCVWRRGFPDEVECPFRVWFFGAPRWLKTHPIRRASVTVPGGVTAYLSDREAGRVTFAICNGTWLKFPHFKCTVSERLVEDLRGHPSAHEVLFFLALTQMFAGVEFALRGCQSGTYRFYTAEGLLV